jgi:uncharacterized caspase-like protein
MTEDTQVMAKALGYAVDDAKRLREALSGLVRVYRATEADVPEDAPRIVKTIVPLPEDAHVADAWLDALDALEETDHE